MTRLLKRRTFLSAAMCASIAVPASAHAFGDRPSTLVVPYPPGGNTDYLGRAVAQRITELTGHPIAVENRPGASGNIGATYAARARPDGSTIMVAPVSIMAINQFMMGQMSFSPERDFVPLSFATNDVMAVAVTASLPVHNMQELVRYLQEHPETAYATSGVGQPMYLAGAMLARRAGVTLVPVVYKGGGPLMTDLIAGNVKLAISGFASMKSFHDTGKLRILAVGEPQRFAGAPGIPALNETYSGLEIPYWAGFWAPTGTPAEIAARWTAEINKALNVPALKDAMLQRGIIVRAQGAAELAAAAQASRAHFGPLIKELGITAQS